MHLVQVAGVDVLLVSVQVAVLCRGGAGARWARPLQTLDGRALPAQLGVQVEAHEAAFGGGRAGLRDPEPLFREAEQHARQVGDARYREPGGPLPPGQYVVVVSQDARHARRAHPRGSRELGGAGEAGAVTDGRAQVGLDLAEGELLVHKIVRCHQEVVFEVADLLTGRRHLDRRRGRLAAAGDHYRPAACSIAARCKLHRFGDCGGIPHYPVRDVDDRGAGSAGVAGRVLVDRDREPVLVDACYPAGGHAGGGDRAECFSLVGMVEYDGRVGVPVTRPPEVEVARKQEVLRCLADRAGATDAGDHRRAGPAPCLLYTSDAADEVRKHQGLRKLFFLEAQAHREPAHLLESVRVAVLRESGDQRSLEPQQGLQLERTRAQGAARQGLRQGAVETDCLADPVAHQGAVLKPSLKGRPLEMQDPQPTYTLDVAFAELLLHWTLSAVCRHALY